MSLNLGNSVDFARATNSLAGDVLLQLQNILDRARGAREWVIQESSFAGIKFHIFKEAGPYNAGLASVQDSGGRRLAIFEFPFVDGQTTDDMGRKGYTFSFDCIIHGANYLEGFKALKERIDNDPTPGDLIHPVIGLVRAKPQSWTFLHEDKSRQAVIIKLEFIEHNFDVGEITVNPDQSSNTGVFKNALAAALQFVSKIGSVIDKVNAVQNIVTSFANTLRRDLEEVQLTLRGTLVSINASFNTDGSTDLPGALPINNGGSTTSDPTGDTGSASTVSVVASPNDPFESMRGTTTDVAVLTPQQAVDAVNAYRDQVSAMIKSIEDAGAELEFYDDILTLQASAIALQAACESGISSSRPRVIQYVTPRVMSVREVAFANGLDPERGGEIDQLNPSLDSLNQIDKGTMLLIPTT